MGTCSNCANPTRPAQAWQPSTCQPIKPLHNDDWSDGNYEPHAKQIMKTKIITNRYYNIDDCDI